MHVACMYSEHACSMLSKALAVIWCMFEVYMGGQKMHTWLCVSVILGVVYFQGVAIREKNNNIILNAANVVCTMKQPYPDRELNATHDQKEFLIRIYSTQKESHYYYE